MKLLMCKACGDIFNLSKTEKTCQCGETFGRYTTNENAVMAGNCIAIGFANKDFSDAYSIQNALNNSGRVQKLGTEFKAFFIPDSAETIKRII